MIKYKVSERCTCDLSRYTRVQPFLYKPYSIFKAKNDKFTLFFIKLKSYYWDAQGFIPITAKFASFLVTRPKKQLIDTFLHIWIVYEMCSNSRKQCRSCGNWAHLNCTVQEAHFFLKKNFVMHWILMNHYYSSSVCLVLYLLAIVYCLLHSPL